MRRKSRTSEALLLSALLVCAGAALPGARAGQPAPQSPANRSGPRISPAGRNGQPARPVLEMVEHLMSLPPEKQREFMRNNPRFRNLPPERKANIQRRLDQFNSLPPGAKEFLRQRFELFRQLPPEKQIEARELYSQMNQASPVRRQMMRQAFRRLHDASPAERRRVLNSPQFRSRFSEEEQRTLRGLSDLLPPGG